MLCETTTTLGPARVTEVQSSRVRLDTDIWAVLALGYPYRPTVGDIVLAIGQGEETYVIGVIRGTGRTTFTAPGDLEFRAPNGKIDVIAGQGIRLRGPDVRVEADRLELVARTVFEKFVQAFRRVADVFQVRAGRTRTVVRSTHEVRAGRIVERASGDVAIDGRRINLG